MLAKYTCILLFTDGTPAAVSTISVATDNARDITNWNQPPLFFHMDPTNTFVWAKKSFIGSVVSCTSQLQPIQVGYSIPVFCCIAYIIARYFAPITGIGHSARTAIQQESHDTSFNVPYKKVGLMLNS
jgi:hypothetical protein